MFFLRRPFTSGAWLTKLLEHNKDIFFYRFYNVCTFHVDCDIGFSIPTPFIPNRLRFVRESETTISKQINRETNRSVCIK